MAEAKNNLPRSEALSFQQIDIQDIPFANNSFDIVIANMMLFMYPI